MWYRVMRKKPAQREEKIWNRNRMSIFPLTVDESNFSSPWTLTMTVKWHFYWRNTQNVFTAWESAIFGSSPGDQSYSGSSSPPLSDDGNVSSSSSTSSNDQKYIIKPNLNKLKINQHNGKIHIRRGQRTTSLSASDEGIVVDYGDEVTRKRKVSTTKINFFKNIFFCVIKKPHWLITRKNKINADNNSEYCGLAHTYVKNLGRRRLKKLI